MIEIKSWSHTIRLYATRTNFSDIFKPIIYFGYRGDIKKVPFYYKVKRGGTAFSDLSLPMENLLAVMKSNTRNEIRRAIKEGCVFKRCEDTVRFINFYNAFCNSKGFSDRTSIARMGKYANVLLTEAVSREGTVLAMHANVLDRKSNTAFLLYSCSQRLDAYANTKLIGWANRFLHYKDMEYLRNEGYVNYDWSGVDSNPNSGTYSIGQFKMSFGGKYSDSYVLLSPVYLMLGKIKEFLSRLR